MYISLCSKPEGKVYVLQSHVTEKGSVAGNEKEPKQSCVNGTPLQYSCLENPTDRGAW